MVTRRLRQLFRANRGDTQYHNDGDTDKRSHRTLLSTWQKSDTPFLVTRLQRRIRWRSIRSPKKMIFVRLFPELRLGGGSASVDNCGCAGTPLLAIGSVGNIAHV